MLHIEVTKDDLASRAADVFAIGLFEHKEGVKLERHDGDELDPSLKGEIMKTLEREKFRGELGKAKLFFTAGRTPFRYLLIAGLGNSRELSRLSLRQTGILLARECEKIKATSLALPLQPEKLNELSAAARLQAVIEGLFTGTYRFERYREAAARHEGSLTRVIVLSSGGRALLEKGIALGTALGEACWFARDLINLPSNDLTPQILARETAKMAKHEGLGIRILGKKELTAEKMGAFLAVTQGSPEPPALIHLSYRPKKPSQHVALVGKAVTFDTGGISIKPWLNMGEMKSDMGGGALVIAVMQAIARLKPRAAVDAYIPAAENMPDGYAFKPGDIIKARSGKTIEIISTDAEGRLLLADVLSYAVDRKPDIVIDFATLTGGAAYALGDLYACLLGNDQRLIDRLLAASRDAGEFTWQLPLEKRYLKGITKGPADLTNSGGTTAQTIGAALFLSQFVGSTKWAHFDIAACAYAKEETPLTPKGATAAIIPTMVNFLCSL